MIEKTGVMLYLMCFLAGCVWMVVAVSDGAWLSSFMAFLFTFSSIGVIFHY